MKILSKKIFWILLVVGSLGFLVPNAIAWKNSLLFYAFPYNRLISKYTRSIADYSLANLHTNYRWRATYHAPDLIAAVDQILKKYYPNGLTPYLEQKRAEMFQKGQTEFFVAMYARDRTLQKLLRKEQLWEVQLITEHQSYDPILVEEVELNPLYFKIYPYLSYWDRGFRVVFPYNSRANPDQEMQLEISGPFGSHRAKYKGN